MKTIEPNRHEGWRPEERETSFLLRPSRSRPTSSDRIIRLEFGYVARVDIRVVVPIASVFDEEEIDRVNKHFDRAFSAEDERFRSVNHTGELEKKKKETNTKSFSPRSAVVSTYSYTNFLSNGEDVRWTNRIRPIEGWRGEKKSENHHHLLCRDVNRYLVSLSLARSLSGSARRDRRGRRKTRAFVVVRRRKEKKRNERKILFFR